MSSVKDTVLGFSAVMVSNTCLLANSYIAKIQPVTPGEIITSRAILQIVLFTLWEAYQRTLAALKSSSSDGDKPVKVTPRKWVTVVIANLLLSCSQIVCYTAVKMIPLSDFVVLCFTSPVFALIASAAIIR